MTSNSIKVAYGSPHSSLNIAGLKISCFILDDMTYVFPLNGVQKLFGHEGKSEIWLLNILQNISKLIKIPKEVLMAYENPIGVDISFYNGNIEHAKVIDSIVVIKTCQTFLEAKNNGMLGVNLIKIAKIAEQILKHADHQSMNEMIDNATGYNNFKAHVKLLVQKYMQTQIKESSMWVTTFPDHFYNTLFEIHNENWNSVKSQPQIIGKLLYDIIFSRISMPLLQALNTNKPKRTYTRKNNQAQNSEHPELKQYLQILLSLLKTSGNNWFIFRQLLNRTFPIQHHYNNQILFERNVDKNAPLSTFNTTLKKFT